MHGTFGVVKAYLTIKQIIFLLCYYSLGFLLSWQIPNEEIFSLSNYIMSELNNIDLFRRVKSYIDNWMQSKVRQYRERQRNPKTRLQTVKQRVAFWTEAPFEVYPGVDSTFSRTPYVELKIGRQANYGTAIPGSYNLLRDLSILFVVNISVRIYIYDTSVHSKIEIKLHEVNLDMPPWRRDRRLCLLLDGGADRIMWDSPNLLRINYQLNFSNFFGGDIRTMDDNQIRIFKPVFKRFYKVLRIFVPQILSQFNSRIPKNKKIYAFKGKFDYRNKLPENMTNAVSLEQVDPKRAFYIKKNVFGNHQIQSVYNKETINKLLLNGEGVAKSPQIPSTTFTVDNVYRYIPEELRPKTKIKKTKNIALGRMAVRAFSQSPQNFYKKVAADLTLKLAALQVKRTQNQTKRIHNENKPRPKRQKKL